MAGAAATRFPVEPGTPLGGYVARTGPATGTLDPLEIGALSLVAGEDELVIVAADVVAVDEALTRQVARSAGISRDALLLAASHTHSGPAGISARLHPASEEQIDHALRRRFVAACAEVITGARARRMPAQVAIGQAETRGLAANRNDPAGPADPTLTAVDVRTSGGSRIAAIVHWACHPTALGADNLLVSADFPGAMRRGLRGRLGTPELPVLYLNGAAGDVSTRFTRQDQSPAEVDRLGEALAEAAGAALDDAEPVVARIGHATATLRLPGWRADAIAAATERAGPDEMSLNPAAARQAVTRAQGLAMLTALAESDCRPQWKTLRLDAWRLGGWRVAAVPGELTADLGMAVRDSEGEAALVVGYAGGYAGYLADRAAYEAGAYEALASWFGPGAGERTAEAAIGLLERLDRAESGGSEKP
jgi:hypothetical protein